MHAMTKKEMKSARHKRWYDKHREQESERRKEWYSKNKEYHKEWRANNRSLVNQIAAN